MGIKQIDRVIQINLLNICKKKRPHHSFQFCDKVTLTCAYAAKKIGISSSYHSIRGFEPRKVKTQLSIVSPWIHYGSSIPERCAPNYWVPLTPLNSHLKARSSIHVTVIQKSKNKSLIFSCTAHFLGIDSKSGKAKKIGLATNHRYQTHRVRLTYQVKQVPDSLTIQ